jgi:hypothetical protein
MNYDDVFTAYYTQYRTELTIPGSTDPEYTIGMRLANEAINRWAHYDNTYWKVLFGTLQLNGDGDNVIVNGVTQYAAPSDMQEAGGYVRLYDSTGATQQRIKIVEPQEAQFKNDSTNYCYFIGDPNNGFTLIINPAPTSATVGLNIDYVYYRKPTLFTTGSDITEMPEPYFIVHRMLAGRFRGSRNPYYASAKTDAEDVLKTMQMTNNSGSWANPWQLQDNSGSQWGI